MYKFQSLSRFFQKNVESLRVYSKVTTGTNHIFGCSIRERTPDIYNESDKRFLHEMVSLFKCFGNPFSYHIWYCQQPTQNWVKLTYNPVVNNVLLITTYTFKSPWLSSDLCLSSCCWCFGCHKNRSCFCLSEKKKQSKLCTMCCYHSAVDWFVSA